MYKYKAMKTGTLSKPYAFIEKGKIVESAVPLDISWLHDVTDGNIPADEPEKPVVPYVGKTSSSEDEPITILDAPSSESYKDNMDSLVSLENHQDAVSEKKASKEVDTSIEVVIDAIAELEVNETNYTNGGKPDANILTDKLNFKVSAVMRDKAFDVYSKDGVKEGDVIETDIEGTGSQEVI